jgi:sporulation protein YlmC with PRC-barrel domain
MIITEQRDTGVNQSPSNMQSLANQLNVQVAETVKTAESRTGGKAVCVKLIEWQSAQNESARPLAQRQFGPSHPVVEVVTLNNGKASRVVMCGKTGEVLDVQDYTGPFPALTTVVSSGNTGMSGSGAVLSSSSDDDWYRPAARWQKASDLMSKEVVSSSGEDIGDVRNLIVDPDSSRVFYYIVDFDNELGHGDKLFAIPPSTLRLSNDYKNLAASFSTGQINAASGFEDRTWPNITDAQWNSRNYQAYGVRPYWETSSVSELRRPPSRWYKAKDLIGKEVRNPQDENLGKLDEIVVDPDSGRILYGVLSFGGFLGLGDKLFAVPWGSLRVTGDSKYVVLPIDKDRLKQAQGFDKDRWPNMADPQWAATTHDYYGQPRYWDASARTSRD